MMSSDTQDSPSHGATQMLPVALWEHVFQYVQGREASAVKQTSLDFYSARVASLHSLHATTQRLRRWAAWAGTPGLVRLLNHMKYFSLTQLRIDDGNNNAALTGDVLDIFLSRCADGLSSLACVEICGIWDIGQQFSLVAQSLALHLPKLRQLSIPAPASAADLAQLLDLPNLTGLTLGTCAPISSRAGAGQGIHWSLSAHAPRAKCEGRLSTAEFEVLSQMTKLQCLRISGVTTLLSAEATNSLAALTKLQELALGQRCTVSHKYPPDFSAWSSLVNLQSFHMDMCRDVDSSVSSSAADMVQNLLRGLPSARLTHLSLNVTTHVPPGADMLMPAAGLAGEGVQGLAAAQELQPPSASPLPVLYLACGACFPTLKHLCLPTGYLDLDGVRVLAEMCPELQNLSIQSVGSLSSAASVSWEQRQCQLRFLKCLEVMLGCSLDVTWDQLSQLLPSLRIMLMPT